MTNQNLLPFSGFLHLFSLLSLIQEKKEKTFWENSTGFVLFEMRKTHCKYMKA